MRHAVQAAPLAAIGLLSATTLAYEILLTRIFAIVHWHHLVGIAISLALLGYGASGTFLALFGNRLQRHFAPAFIGNAVLFSLSAPLCVALAQQVPFDPEALAWDVGQLFYLAGAFLTLAIPFFAAANCIGLALWHFKDQIPRVYGFDLIGAGVGAIAVLLTLVLVPPQDALLGIFASGMLVSVIAAATWRWHLSKTTLFAVLLTALVAGWARPTIQPAPYKDLAQAMSVYGAVLQEQLNGVAGAVSLVRNDEVPLRVAPGLSLQSDALPPRQLAVFVDGDAAGTLGDYSGNDAGAYFQDLVSALPYALRHPSRVAVLGAGTGQRVQQALALGATSVTAVEPNPELHRLTCERHPELGREQCDPARVSWRIQAPRAFVAGAQQPFDLISLAAEADPTGLDALAIDFALTEQAFLAYLQHLAPRGLLAIEGPTRLPPRLSLRILATAHAALVADGIAQPEQHIVMVRAWQRFVLLVSRGPFDAAQLAAVRRFAEGRGFDLVWLPGIEPKDVNRFQQLNEPLFFWHAAHILGSPLAPAGLQAPYRLASATDDRPFPTLSTTWPGLWQALVRGDAAEVSGLDAGLLIGAATLALVTLASVILIALPLLWLRQAAGGRPRRGSRIRAFTYFGLVGIAFLFLEMAWIQRLQLFLGHPVYAATSVLAAFLVFAGLGSLWAQRRSDALQHRRLPIAVGTILLFSLLYLLFLPGWLETLAGLPIAMRIVVVLVFLAPLAFAMGIPFPTGLRNLGTGAPQLIPWAWGINGCASVISAVAAPLVAAEIGLDGLITIAVAAYLMLPFIRLGRPEAATRDGQPTS